MSTNVHYHAFGSCQPRARREHSNWRGENLSLVEFRPVYVAFRIEEPLIWSLSSIKCFETHGCFQLYHLDLIIFNSLSPCTCRLFSRLHLSIVTPYLTSAFTHPISAVATHTINWLISVWRDTSKFSLNIPINEVMFLLLSNNMWRVRLNGNMTNETKTMRDKKGLLVSS